MKHYPVYLNLKGRTVLVVGAGRIGLQKIRPLLACGARVHVVAPKAQPEIRRLAREGKIDWSARSYKAADTRSASLVIAATDNPELQKKISRDARARGLWVNVVDVPALCSFIAPAVISRGNIQIAISTGGAAPALAKYLRRKLDSLIGPEHEEFAQLAQKRRPDILKLPKKKRRALWKRIVSDAFFAQVRSSGVAAERLLSRR
jgi:precorrin-2 dehydrogenase/sirohydrochlorin ferrochelatase